MKHAPAILSRWIGAGIVLSVFAALTSCDKKVAAPAPLTPSPSQDWPMWGGTPARNMVSPGKNPPVEFKPGKRIKGKDEIDRATTEGLKWTGGLGSQS